MKKKNLTKKLEFNVFHSEVILRYVLYIVVICIK